MRLDNQTKKIILDTTKKYFANSKLYLFGSRSDDTKKGGDIDLYLQLDSSSYSLEKKLHFLVELKEKIGEQKIDLVVDRVDLKRELPIYKVAQQEGIFLG